jgi:hypothetical protein
MATKVYLSGDVVVVDKLGFPPVVNILVTQCKYQLIAVIEHENAEVIDYKDISIIDYVNNIVITDLVTDIQDIGGTPIGDLNQVIKYLSGFINVADFNIIEQEQGGGGGGGGEINTGSNVGTGDGVFKQKTGVDLEFKTLIGGTNVSIANNTNDLTINATGTGEVNTASNAGTGEGVFKNKVALDLVFRTLVAGTNVSFVGSINELEINASGTGNYFKDSVIITSNSNNFNSGTPTDIPLMTYTITQDGDYILYSIVNTNPDQDEGFNLYYAINGTTVNDSIVCQEFKKNKDVSIQGTWDVDGLVIGDIITIQGDTQGDNQDLKTRRIIVQTWT